MLHSLRSALPLALLSLVACSGSNFELGSAADSGQPINETGNPVSENPDADSDAAALDTAPACDTRAPALACSAPGSNYAPQFQFAGVAELAPLVDDTTSHAISYVTARAGRHEKMILRLRRKTLTGANVGHLTLTAFHTPCPGVHVPLGKSRSFPADTVNDGDISFYFADATTFLPLFPAGTRLTFVLSTDSTAFAFELIGSESTADAPPSLEWYVRKDGGAWTTPSTAKPSAQAWLRDCAG